MSEMQVSQKCKGHRHPLQSSSHIGDPNTKVAVAVARCTGSYDGGCGGTLVDVGGGVFGYLCFVTFVMLYYSNLIGYCCYCCGEPLDANHG